MHRDKETLWPNQIAGANSGEPFRFGLGVFVIHRLGPVVAQLHR